MRRLCCRCGKEMGPIPSDAHGEDIISHGFCEPCAERFMSEEPGESLQKFLDSFDVPVLVIETGPRVRAVNSRACSLFGKSASEIQGRKGGEVIGCVNARTKGGCGADIHCESCTIRETLLETSATGKSFEKVPAYPDIYIDREVRNVCLEISTEKVGGMVLLRIDDLRMRNEAETRVIVNSCVWKS